MLALDMLDGLNLAPFWSGRGYSLTRSLPN